ncbi:acyltransferase ChoActase/COT/CPT [Hesseltinella vesiculosa]|uniref:Carnitine O-acetyltransferase, mitochondrial n=1 Tax=Hesseltinella vesiculosa TaxID=101127 RepID=A0A1X2G2J0_9FUNG|nr:acyltransferase ChoActase/COT/CPT [Hesseltinella vesiculosa]
MAPKTPVDASAAGPMLQYQKNLPKLPVPGLERTVAMYLKTLQPVLSEEKYKEAEVAAKEFLQPGGAGLELQKRLEAKANDPNVVNWMEDWWLDQAYMGYRESVVINVSYFFGYKDDKLRKKATQRAAAITTGVLAFKKQIVEKTLPVEYAKGEPLCMDSYKYMFNNCRIPQKPSDIEASFDPVKNTHIIVIRKNRFFFVDVVHNGVQLSTSELEQQFERVVALAGQDKGLPLGVLTADNRDNWTDARAALLTASAENKTALELIESSSFVVCLDDTAPATRDELSRACWHGDGRNRYFDKPLQFVVFENGKAGFIGEHSCMDGMVTCRLNNFVCEGIAKNKLDHGRESVRPALPQPKEIQLVTDVAVQRYLNRAEKNFDEAIANHELTVLAYNGLGKRQIKQFKCSPDAFAQMVIQLGYYKMFGVSRPTYEAGMTRKYQRGRTETTRTVSNECVAFVKTMEDPVASNPEKVAAFRAALKAQGAYMGQAVNAHGVDRHLFGLKNSLRPGEPVPSLFAADTFGYASHWFLSTSQLSSEYFDAYGWGQVVSDGFGVAYMVNNDVLQFNIASVKDLTVNGKQYIDGTYHFKQALEDAATELRDVMLAETPAQAKL